MGTQRQQIIALLEGATLTVRDLATLLRRRARDIESDLAHVQQSLGRRLLVHPAFCDSCGASIARAGNRFSAPSRCPYCKSERTSPPLLEIVD